MPNTLASSTFPYLLIDMSYQNYSGNDEKDKCAIISNITENANYLPKGNNDDESGDKITEIYLATWRESRLYFYNGQKKLLFKSSCYNSNFPCNYKHYTDVIYSMQFENIVKLSPKNYNAKMELFLEKDEASSYGIEFQHTTSLFPEFTRLMNYLYIQSDVIPSTR
jgi:hypothetical protein